jgi:Family of unknown function (DUF6152)
MNQAANCADYAESRIRVICAIRGLIYFDLPGSPIKHYPFFVKHFLAIATIFAVVAAPAYAHHSFARAYYENRSISISGEVVAFEFRSPHAWVHLMAPDETGQLQKYSAEWFNPSRLSRMKITKDTLKPGDRVVMSGSPSRNVNERTLHLKRIERPADGWKCC